DPWIDENREALELAREVVGRQLGSLAVRANVKKAELWVDGVMVGRLPLEAPLRVRAGVIRVEARAPGQVAARTETTVAAGELTELLLTLSPLPMRPPAPSIAPPTDEPSWRPWIYASAAVGGASLVVGGAL